MHPIEVKQVKEIILVSDDVHASRRLYRETLGLAMPATADRLNLARVGSQYLGAAQAGVMNHPGFTGRLHLGLESIRQTLCALSSICGGRASRSPSVRSSPGTWTRRRASAPTSSIQTPT